MNNINYYCECFEEFLENNESIIAEKIANDNNLEVDDIFYNDVVDLAKEMYDDYVASKMPF